jgi:tight adherence protein B
LDVSSVLPLILSIVFGAGVYLLYEGLTRPARAAPGQSRRWRNVEQFLARAGVQNVSAGGFVSFCLAAGLISGAVAQVLLGWSVVSLLAAAVAAVAPLLYFIQRHDRRRGAVQAALADSISQLRDSIRTGLSVQQALIGLARSGPDELRPEFAVLVREARLVGFEPALRTMRDSLADPVFDVVAAALVLNDQVGGRNVSQVLDRLAHATRAQLRIQEELRAYQSRNVLSARIVAAVPLIVLVAIRSVSPEYLALFDGWVGQLVLVGCVLSIAAGYAGMRWLARLPGEQRVLVR